MGATWTSISSSKPSVEHFLRSGGTEDKYVLVADCLLSVKIDAMSGRGPRWVAGTIRNLASQLAQLTVDWQASFDGPKLLAGPRAGEYAIDILSRRATLNGTDVDLSITRPSPTLGPPLPSGRSG